MSAPRNTYGNEPMDFAELAMLILAQRPQPSITLVPSDMFERMRDHYIQQGKVKP